MNILWYPAISLDGYIATADGDSSWVGAADEELFNQVMTEAGCVILGRVTYEQFKDTIYQDQSVTKFVVSSARSVVPNSHQVIFVPPVAKVIIETIQKSGFNRAILSGGGQTNALFAEANLIDQAWISIYPFTLGSGIKLLGESFHRLDLKLTESLQLTGGIVQNRYVRSK